jgi:hypothetical protein
MYNFHIPRTISSEAQEYLEILNLEAVCDPFPAVDDLQGWKLQYELNEAYFKELDADRRYPIHSLRWTTCRDGSFSTN